MRKSMPQKKKAICSAALSVLTLLALFWLIFRNHYKEILQNIQTASIGGLFWILCLGIVYQLLDSLLCHIFIKRKMQRFSFRQAAAVTLLGVFGNVATFSVGSIPMQGAYLYRRGMAPGEAAGILSMEYVLHKAMVLLCSGVLLLLEGQSIFGTHPNLRAYAIFGYMVCMVIIALLVLICTWERFYQLVCKGICRLEKSPKLAEHAVHLKQQIGALHTGARELLHEPNMILVGAGINAVKLMGLYTIPYLCAKAIGIDQFSLIQMQALSALTHVVSNALPNIAGMGSIEVSFLLLFSCYMDAADVSSVLVLYRVATYFVPFLISAFAAQKIGLRLCTGDSTGISMQALNLKQSRKSPGQKE